MGSNEVDEAVKLRVYFIPFYATSHIIPMFDLARLMASRPGVEATFFLTPANAAIVRPAIDRCATSVRLHIYPFPSAEVDLPPGHESIAAVPFSESWKLDKATRVVRDTIDPIIRGNTGPGRPDAVITDFHFWWAISTAHELGIPGVYFSAIGNFPQALLRYLLVPIDAEDNEPFDVPGLPGPPIKMVRSEMPRHINGNDAEFGAIVEKVLANQHQRFGGAVNTFYELEPLYSDLFKKNECSRAWFVGPVALAVGDGADRGGSAESRERCMAWLEGRAPGSVVFVCFGSWCHFTEEQLCELALGLEASGQAFMWVVRRGAEEEWMQEGWEERVKGRGMVVRGWAPQVAILGHPAVGAFMTHCGWNSIMEAVSAGVPLLTWPLVFEQFINEKLVTDVMKAGVKVWEGARSVEPDEKTLVPREAIGRAVAEFMEPGGKGEEARRRAGEYGELAKASQAEGGSANTDLIRMVDELMEAAGKKKPAA